MSALMILSDYGSDKMKLTERVLKDAVGADMDDIHWACLMDKRSGEKLSDEDMAGCVERLKHELKVTRPKVILTVGDIGMKMLTGDTGIMKNHGKVTLRKFKSSDGELEVSIIPTFSPYYVDKVPNSLNDFARDVDRAYNIAKGIITEVEGGPTKIVVVDTWAKVQELIGYIKTTGVCCFDFESTKIEKAGAGVYSSNFKATLLSFSFQHGSAWCIPLFHFESPFDEQMCKDILRLVGLQIFANPKIRKIAHNLKFDMQVANLYGAGIFRGRLDDTMLMHHLIDEDAKHGLKEIGAQYFPQFTGYDDAIKKYEWHLIPLELLCPYGGTDTDLTFRICTLLESILIEDDRVYRIYRNLQMNALPMLYEAEVTGMLMNEDWLDKNLEDAKILLDKQEEKLRGNKIVRRFEEAEREAATGEELARLEDKAVLAKGKSLLNYKQRINEVKSGLLQVYDGINFASNPQLSKLLYSKHGFGYKKVWDRKKQEEAEKTGKEVLLEFRDHTGFIADLLLYRTIAKTYSTYLVGMSSRLDRQHRLHTSFLQHGTETGRLSSRNPNLQNLSNVAKLKDDIAIKVVSMVKKPFIPPVGHYIAQFDYKQAELMIVADFANERVMIDAYNRGEDLHALTASSMMGKTLAEFYELPAKEQKDWRSKAKPVNFGLIYGMSVEGLVDYAKNNYGVTMTLDEATKWRNNFFKLYPRLLVYHETMIAKARKFGNVRTLFGRKRQTPDILHSNDFIRSMDERIAINDPVQGTAGEFTIFAAALLKNRIDITKIKFVNTIHDSLIFYIPFDLMESASRVIKHTMENLPVEEYFGKALQHLNMKVDIEYSDISWKDMSEYKFAA